MVWSKSLKLVIILLNLLPRQHPANDRSSRQLIALSWLCSSIIRQDKAMLVDHLVVVRAS